MKLSSIKHGLWSAGWILLNEVIRRRRQSRQEGQLAYASLYGDAATVEALLECGANPNLRLRFDQSLLSLVCDRGEYNAARMLLDRGANVNAVNPWSLHTALHRASYAGRLEVVRLLLERGAEIDSRNRLGVTPMMEAALAGRLEVVRLLLERGAGIDCKAYRGTTALAIARTCERTEVVAFLEEELRRRRTCSALQKGDRDAEAGCAVGWGRWTGDAADVVPPEALVGEGLALMLALGLVGALVWQAVANGQFTCLSFLLWGYLVSSGIAGVIATYSFLRSRRHSRIARWITRRLEGGYGPDGAGHGWLNVHLSAAGCRLTEGKTISWQRFSGFRVELGRIGEHISLELKQPPRVDGQVARILALLSAPVLVGAAIQLGGALLFAQRSGVRLDVAATGLAGLVTLAGWARLASKVLELTSPGACGMRLEVLPLREGPPVAVLEAVVRRTLPHPTR